MLNALVTALRPSSSEVEGAGAQRMDGYREFPSEFDEASSGLEAIERLALSSVSLIILDLNMPDMHGMEVVEFVRKHQSYRSIPIIVLTTRGDETSRSASALEKTMGGLNLTTLW